MVTYDSMFGSVRIRNTGVGNVQVLMLKGETGKTAYQYAVENGYEGTEEEFQENVTLAGNSGQHFATLDSDVAALDSRLDTAESDIDTLEDTTGGLDTRLTAAENDIDSLETSTSGLNTRLTAAESDIDALQTSATGLNALVAYFTDGADGVPMKSAVAYVEPVQDTSGGNPTPSNIVAVTGSTGTVLRVAKGYALEQGAITEGTGNKSANTARLRTADLIPVSVLGADSTIIDVAGTNRANLRIKRLFFYDSTGTYLGQSSAPSVVTETLPFSFASSRIPTDAAFFHVSMQIGANGTETLTYDGQRLIIEPVSYTVDWTNEAGAIYGGYIDLATGVLTVTHGIFTPVKANINRNSGTSYYVRHSACGSIADGALHRVYSNMFAAWNTGDATTTPGICYLNGEGGIRFNTLESYSSIDDMLAAHSGLYFVYELEAKTTYQLTAQQIATLLGENTVYTPTGNTSVVYVRDLTTVIDELEEDTEIAVSGTTPTIVAKADKRYLCGTVTSISFTPSAKGLCEVVFTSGTSPAVLTGVDNVRWPALFNPASLAANTIYDLMVSDGTLGVVVTWAA